MYTGVKYLTMAGVGEVRELPLGAAPYRFAEERYERYCARTSLQIHYFRIGVAQVPSHMCLISRHPKTNQIMGED